MRTINPRAPRRVAWTALAGIAALALAMPALARGSRDRGDHGNSHDRGDACELRYDHDELRDDRREVRDDRRDYRELAAIVDAWTEAAHDGSRRAMGRADRDLVDWLTEELREARRELDEARGEARGSRREAFDDGDRGRGHGHGYARYGTRAGWDDTRDLRDDRRDRRAARRYYRELRDIADDLAFVQEAFDLRIASGRDYRRKGRLLDELLALAGSEIGEDYRELDEDRGELREDTRDGCRGCDHRSHRRR